MPKRRDLRKEEILAAMAMTKSNMAAARYLNVSYHHYRRWAKFYKDQETGKTLFEVHLNENGVGIPKLTKHRGKAVDLRDVIEGRVPIDTYTPEKLKERLFIEGYLEERCYICGFNERRVIDNKVPLLLNFKDGNKKNWRIENLEVLCYNHFFLYLGDILNNYDKLQLLEVRPISKTTEAHKFELDDYHVKRLQDLGLYDQPKPEDNELISRKW